MAKGSVHSAVKPHCSSKLQASVEEGSTTSGSNSASRSTSPSVSNRVAPRNVRFCEDEEEQIIVKGTFLDLDNGSSLADRYKLIRKSKTDSNLYDKLDLEVYEPGKYSDEVQSMLHDKPDLEVYEPGACIDEAQSRLGEDKPRYQVPTEQAWNQPQHVVGLPLQPVHAFLVAEQPKRRTTVMLKNIPNNYTRDMLLSMLDAEGFEGLYDFVYLPCDFDRDANLGYSFVNMTSSHAVDALWKAFEGFSNWGIPTAKVCQVSWSGAHQGLAAHVERYRNSPVMHKTVRDDYKPVIFAHGVRQPFPAPTKKIKAPGQTSRR